MGKIKGFLFAVRHREILMTDLGLCMPSQITYTLKRPPYSPQWHIRQPILLTIVGHREAHAVQT